MDSGPIAGQSVKTSEHGFDAVALVLSALGLFLTVPLAFGFFATHLPSHWFVFVDSVVPAAVAGDPPGPAGGRHGSCTSPFFIFVM